MTIIVKEVIEENDFYKLCVVQLPDVPVDVYGIVNKAYNVCELSVSVLPQAKESFSQFTKWMSDESTKGSGLPDLAEEQPNGALS